MQKIAWFAAQAVAVTSLSFSNMVNRVFSKKMSFDVSEFEVTWSELDAATPETQKPDLQTGPSSAKALVRGEAPEITFYRDSASWCPYSQKVWNLLEESEMAYKVEKINMACYGSKPASFFQVQPSGTLPAAVIDDKIYGTSDSIVAAVLDRKKNVDPRKDPRCNDLLRLERQHFSAWLNWLTRGEENKERFVQVLDAVEDAIAGPYFLGQTFSYIDIAYAPFLERMAASLAYFKGFVVRETPYLRNSKKDDDDDDDLYAFTAYPKLNAWFDAMETRPAYQATMADFYTHAHDLPPQLGGCVKARNPAAEAVRADVDGGAWRGDPPKFEKLSSWVLDPKAEAAARLAENGPAVARFAARAVGGPGFPPARAELADPNATPNDSVVPLIDAVLRLIVLRLRGLSDDAESSKHIFTWLPPGEDNDATKEYARECLAYLRDRVGVPRDMSFPAALELRKQCNDLIYILSTSPAS